jgi:glycosyltransferase involved in cell wall biosynthesis
MKSVTVVLDTDHVGPVGGGENYLVRLADALDKVSEFYVVRHPHETFAKFNGFGGKYERYSGLFVPDIYIHASHFTKAYPIGKKNFQVCFFPKVELKPDGYDGVISICDYTAKWVETYWGMKSDIIYPCIDESLYSSPPGKLKQIVSIGHFFEEENGQSKNQHILVSAFSKSLQDAGYTLLLIGNANPNDFPYVNKVKQCAEGKAVRVEINKDNRFLRQELSRSQFLWHGNGYGRTSPAEAEHFGIIVLEAIASGVIPIVHASGGASEIAKLTWDKPEQLAELTLAGGGYSELRLQKLEDKYTLPFFNKRVEEWLKSIG